MPTKLHLAVLAVFMMFVTMTDTAVADAHEAKAQKAVLVTGASTGIGRKITEKLAADGYFVYAGARKQKDIDELNAIKNVQAVRLDVTVQEEIDAAVETVRKGGRGLWGLVNNAGIGGGGPAIEYPVEDVQWLFDVNVWGVYRVTQAFAPMIIESKGRITTIGSISGISTGAFWAAYSMSKHAIEAYTDALAPEMERFGVEVSVIEPGNYNSEIGKSVVARRAELTEAQKASPFADYYTRLAEYTGDRSQFQEPDDVAAAAMHALFDENPQHRYMVVPNKDEAAWAVGGLIREMVQLNQNQPHAFTRDELIAMMDKAIAEESGTAEAGAE
jgi:NAD(P)-dependent dehydrogenase (short-subunit alcohol dehydrogenase family)